MVSPHQNWAQDERPHKPRGGVRSIALSTRLRVSLRACSGPYVPARGCTWLYRYDMMKTLLPGVQVLPALPGLILPGGWTVQDVVVFLDYQNVYKRARELFHDRYDAHWCGQIDPARLAQHILDRPSPFKRRLKQVRVYRGIPIDARDPKGYAAARRQHAEWQKNPLVKVFARPLRYPYGWPDSHQIGEKPGEKGVDVALAVDFVAMAVRQEFDAGILFSVDTDMKPVLEFVNSSDVPARPEVAAWKNPSSADYHRRLSLGGNKPFCHWLDDIDYNIVSDPTDYTQPA